MENEKIDILEQLDVYDNKSGWKSSDNQLIKEERESIIEGDFSKGSNI